MNTVSIVLLVLAGVLFSVGLVGLCKSAGARSSDYTAAISAIDALIEVVKEEAGEK